jgi:hypothetical protein
MDDDMGKLKPSDLKFEHRPVTAKGPKPVKIMQEES